MSIIVFDLNMKITDGFHYQNDSHCKFQRIWFMRSWVDFIYDSKGLSEPAFTTMSKISSGFRTYCIVAKIGRSIW